MKVRFAFIFAALMALSVLAAAETLTGSVRNATTNKPAAGDDVVLLSLSQGMNESARTKTDAQGRFQFKIDDPQTPHLVRVNHQDVNYFKMAPPGTTSADIDVYEAAKKLADVGPQIHVTRYQTDGSVLQVMELIEVRNASSPPRTLMSDRTFEIYLPDGAQIDSSLAQAPGGQPVTTAPVPAGEEGRYYFVFPIRPGATRFQIAYHLPYAGKATIEPKLVYPVQHYVLMLPKAMQFAPKKAGTYQPMKEEMGAEVQVATNAKPGQELGFTLSGSGMLVESEGGQDQPQAQGTADDRRPGGGLGAPTETPDPLRQYRWSILGGLAAVLSVGVLYAATRATPAPATPEAPVAKAKGGSPALLEALKEELFQLEVDRQQGRISREEYDSAKAALDKTIQRALSRKTSF